MTRREKASPLAVKGMAYAEIGVEAVAVMGEVWGGLGYITGRGHLSIHVNPVLSHLPWNTALSATPPSLFPAPVNMRLGPVPPIGSPPGPYMPVGLSASAPPSSPLGVSCSGPPSVIPPGL